MLEFSDASYQFFPSEPSPALIRLGRSLNRRFILPGKNHRIAEILQAAEYRGYVVLEFEESEDPREACPRHLDALRDAFA